MILNYYSGKNWKWKTPKCFEFLHWMAKRSGLAFEKQSWSFDFQRRRKISRTFAKISFQEDEIMPKSCKNNEAGDDTIAKAWNCESESEKTKDSHWQELKYWFETLKDKWRLFSNEIKINKIEA